MLSLKRLVLLGVALASWVNARSSTGNSVLVVVEPSRKNDFSIFFDGLQGVLLKFPIYDDVEWTLENGYELSFRAPKDESPLLVEYDEPMFAHVIVLASESKRTVTPMTGLVNFSLLTSFF